MFSPLNWNAKARPTTRKSEVFGSAPLISSVIPSEKNSWLASPVTFAKGKTAMEIALPTDADAARAAATLACNTAELGGAVTSPDGRTNTQNTSDPRTSEVERMDSSAFVN